MSTKNRSLKYAQELTITVVSTLLGVIYGFVTSKQPGSSDFDSITYGFFTSLLLATFGLLFQQIKTVPKIEHLLQEVKTYEQDLQRLADTLSADGDRLSKLRTHLASRSPFMKLVGQHILGIYTKQIQTTDFGFTLESEHWALKGYEKFWQHLVEEQQRQGNDDGKRLIARITHANNIKIWLDEEFLSSTLLMHQGAFVRAGGIIIRILVGPYKNLEDPEAKYYLEAKKRMSEYGIVTKYVSSLNINYSYDFAWIDNPSSPTSGDIVKWYSGAGGQMIDKCEFLDELEEGIRDTWIALAYRVTKSETADDKEAITQVLPQSRQLENYGMQAMRQNPGII
jgi:hypothetical protein